MQSYAGDASLIMPDGPTQAAHSDVARELLIRCRAVLSTCRNDSPNDLLKPERAAVIARLTGEITTALGA